MKAATSKTLLKKIGLRISIHAAREGGDWVISNFTESVIISIHAAREGGDGIIRAGCKLIRIFQSTPPVKAATWKSSPNQTIAYISIHAAREGGDVQREDRP